MLKGIGTEPSMLQAQNKGNNSQLREACGEFEALFLNYMLKTSRSTVPDGGFLGDSHEGEMIKSMFDENLSRVIAGNGGMGMGSLLYEQLRERIE